MWDALTYVTYNMFASCHAMPQTCVRAMNGVKVTGKAPFSIFDEACKGEMRKSISGATSQLRGAFVSLLKASGR